MVSKKKKDEVDYKNKYRQALKELGVSFNDIEFLKSTNSKLIEDKFVCNKQISRMIDEIDELKKKNSLYLSYEESFKKLQNSLIGCLSKDESEAAKIAGCEPETYAVELLKIYQDWKTTNRMSHEYGRDSNPNYRDPSYRR